MQLRKIDGELVASCSKEVPAMSLKRNVDYVLTWDFYPHGGEVVRLEKFVPAKEHFDGQRGECAVVKNASGRRYIIHKDSFLYSMPE